MSKLSIYRRSYRVGLSLAVAGVIMASEVGVRAQVHLPAARTELEQKLRPLTRTIATKKELNIQPEWAVRYQERAEVLENSAVLGDLQYGVKNRSSKPEVEILDDSTTKELGIAYSDIERDREQKERYGLSTQADDFGYFKTLSNFSRHMMTRVFSFQLNSNLKKAEKNSEEIRTFNQVHQTVGKMAKGESSFNFNQHFHFGTTADLPKQKGGLWMKSTLVNGSVEAQVGEPWAYDPFTFSTQSTQNNVRDRYVFNLHRKLLFDTEAAFSYGASSTLLNYSLGRELFPRLRAELSAVRAISPGSANRPGGYEETMKLTYGIRF